MATRFLSGLALSSAPDKFRGLASTLMRCNSIADMRALAPLPKDAQELIDRAVVQVGLERLVVAADIMSEIPTFDLPDPLSIMELYWEREAKVGHAIRVMQPAARGERQMPDRKPNRIPIYATTDDFSFNARVLRASQRSGQPIDTSMVQQATRRVNESIEDATINGAGLTVDGNEAPGILNAPGANTEILTASWNTATGEQILADVLRMIDDAQTALYFGPYNLYVGTTYGNALNADFKANSDKTIRQRLEEIEVGGRNLRVRVADRIPTDTVVLLQMTSDVTDMIVGQLPAAVSWEDGPGWERFFVVLAFVIPRVKRDYEDRTGIVIGTP